MLSRYPDMPRLEADQYLAKIEHAENLPICHAVLGRIDKEELNDDALRTFNEFQHWALDRTRRFRNEQWNARRRGQETRTALKLNELFQKGIVNEQTLLLYGISGPLPERDAYRVMSDEEKEALWVERMESRFGPRWRQRFNNVPVFVQKKIVKESINWRQEGF